MKHFNKKKTIIVIVSVIVISALLFTVYYSASVYGSFINPRIYYADFDNYEDDFKKVCAWVKEYSNAEDVTLIVSESSLGDGCVIDGGYDVEIPEDIVESLRAIKEAWGPKTTFQSIKVRGTRVYFCSYEYPYYVVYSPKGKPWRAFGEWVFSERICKNWYHVTRN